MKLVGVKEFYNITRAKVVSALNCAIVITVCATATFIVDASLDSTSVQAKPIETFPQTSETEYVAVQDETEETTGQTDEVMETTTVTVKVTVISTPDSTDTTTETSSTEETTAAAETTAESTASTTAAKETVTEKELYLAVYATTAINVRSGPGTNYDVVKGLNQGDQIDVIAETSNGWYKTYNGNYVSKDYVSEKKPSATTTNTSKPTTRQTEEETEEVVEVTTTTTEEEVYDTPSGNGNSCTITFYGPQSNGDGTYNTSTATGTTCTEGRTCAADWSIYPAGTVIYIENDPLGGDGYYTVEDRGPGVKGYHIDIYADDGETGAHHTCTRTVYAQ